MCLLSILGHSPIMKYILPPPCPLEHWSRRSGVSPASQVEYRCVVSVLPGDYI